MPMYIRHHYAVITTEGVRRYDNTPLHLLLDRMYFADTQEWQIVRPANGQLVARKRDVK